MAKAHSEKVSSYSVKTDYGTFQICYGCKVLGVSVRKLQRG